MSAMICAGVAGSDESDSGDVNQLCLEFLCLSLIVLNQHGGSVVIVTDWPSAASLLVAE